MRAPPAERGAAPQCKAPLASNDTALAAAGLSISLGVCRLQPYASYSSPGLPLRLRSILLSSPSSGSKALRCQWDTTGAWLASSNRRRHRASASCQRNACNGRHRGERILRVVVRGQRVSERSLSERSLACVARAVRHSKYGERRRRRRDGRRRRFCNGSLRLFHHRGDFGFVGGARAACSTMSFIFCSNYPAPPARR